jgi:hypothetical protein
VATVEEIQRWWQQHPASNVGLALVAQVRIDIEGPEARARLDEISGGDLPKTLEFTSGRSDGAGEGWLYQLPSDVRLRTVREGMPLGGELRLQGLGAQTVLPPSRHRSGRRYDWKPGHGIKDGAVTLAPAWLLTQLCDKAKHQRTPRPQRCGDGKDIALALSALKGLNPARAVDYDSWLKVGMILHSIDNGDEMLTAWDAWSKCSGNYEDGVCECKWGAFDADADGGITLGSLIHWAKEDGWTPGGKRKEREPTNAEVLLRLASDGSELWHTADGVAYATIRRDGHREHWPVRTRGYKDWLRKLFYDVGQKAIGGQTLLVRAIEEWGRT